MIKIGRLYYIPQIKEEKVYNIRSFNEWNQILGYKNFQDLKKLPNMWKDMSIDDYRNEFCDPCALEKGNRKKLQNLMIFERQVNL